MPFRGARRTLPLAALAVTGASGDITGGGTVHWDLSSPVARIDQEQNGTVVMRIDQGGTPIELRQTMRQRYQIRPL